MPMISLLFVDELSAVDLERGSGRAHIATYNCNNHLLLFHYIDLSDHSKHIRGREILLSPSSVTILKEDAST